MFWAKKQENEMKEQTTGFNGMHVFLAFVGGAAAGAAVALLTTPKSGPQLRTDIERELEHGRDQAKALPSAVKNAAHAASDAFSGTMHKA